MKRVFSFDEVTLVPQKNSIKSRLDVDLSTQLTKNIRVGMPLVPSNMESVIGTEMAEVIVKNNGIPIFSKFATFEQKVDWIQKFPDCFISCGLEDQIELGKLIKDHGLKRVCLDVAHAHTDRAWNLLDYLKFLNVETIAGNVSTPEGFEFLVNAGANAIRVGQGTGSQCLTNDVTACGLPQFSTVLECGEVSKSCGVPLIADGGISNSRDLVLALAAGASMCMLGGAFAATKESAGRIDDSYGNVVYRGQSSKSFQESFYGKVKEGTVVEGKEESMPIRGSTQDVIDELLGGLRSALTYCGARTIKELQANAEFRERRMK